MGAGKERVRPGTSSVASLLRRETGVAGTGPPYCPDLNPIENAFTKMKAHVERPPPEPSKLLKTQPQMHS